MNNSNFNALFDPKSVDIKAMFEHNEPSIFKEMMKQSPEKQREMIETNQVPMPEGLTTKIKMFIARKRAAGVQEERIKRLVKKKFHITVI